MQIRVGGQALADGVLMRTNRSWAIARADGSVQTGSFRAGKIARVPFLRVFAGIGSALAISIKRTARSGKNRIFFLVILLLTLAAWPLDRYISTADIPAWALALYGPASLLVVIIVMRLIVPRAIWRYHGAEHKAVAAFEQGVDLEDTAKVLTLSRIHDRCGTNLIFLIALVTMIPMPSGALGGTILVASLAGVAELLGYSVRNHPRSLMTKILVGGGRFLQRTLTTKEPSASEQRVACIALTACLAEHHKALYGELAATPLAS